MIFSADVRNAPALEGGEGFKNLVRSMGTSKRWNTTHIFERMYGRLWAILVEFFFFYISAPYFIVSLDDFMNKSNGEGTATGKSTASSSFSYTAVSRLWKGILIGMLLELWTEVCLVFSVWFYYKIYTTAPFLCGSLDLL